MVYSDLPHPDEEGIINRWNDANARLEAEKGRLFDLRVQRYERRKEEKRQKQLKKEAEALLEEDLRRMKRPRYFTPSDIRRHGWIARPCEDFPSLQEMWEEPKPRKQRKPTQKELSLQDKINAVKAKVKVDQENSWIAKRLKKMKSWVGVLEDEDEVVFSDVETDLKCYETLDDDFDSLFA